MSRPSEDPALADLKAGKAEALAAVVDAHSGVLLRGALGLGLPMSEAEDLVQEAFAAFLGAVGRFEGRSSVRTFLFGILYRKAMERSRKNARELPTDPADEAFEKRFAEGGHWANPPKGPEAEVLGAEDASLIVECLDSLSERQRAAFHLREVEGESADAVCGILDVQPENLRVLLFRARNGLRECLERKWGRGK